MKYFQITKLHIIEIIIFFILFTCLGIISIHKYSKNLTFTYQGEIWADKAGYYVYLPALFHYHFKLSKFPENIEYKTGYGFTLDTIHKKVISKYPIGVALLETPFYLVSELFPDRKEDISGFTTANHLMIRFASVFWLCIGIFFLVRFLKAKYSITAAILTAGILLFGTNLYYYTIYESGMSHVYSFSMFCVFIYYFHKFKLTCYTNTKYLIFLSILGAVIILIRQINIIFIFFTIILNLITLHGFEKNISSLISLKNILIVLIIIIILMIPQLLYYKYAYNNLFSYSYENEYFIWSHPKILKFLFSTNNGMFLYVPLYVIISFSIIYYIFNHKFEGIIFACSLLCIIYVFSSWHCWSYGCSFGQRPTVEYLALFSIPLTSLIYNILIKSKLIIKLSFFSLLIFIILYNLKLTSVYDKCFYGTSWDWNEYKRYFVKINIFPFIDKYSYFTNFENEELNRFQTNPKTIETSNLSYSGIYVSRTDSIMPYSSGFEAQIDNITNTNLSQVKGTAMCFTKGPIINGLKLIIEVNSTEGQKILWQSVDINNQIQQDKWSKIQFNQKINTIVDKYHILKVYFWNQTGVPVFIDDFFLTVK